MKIFYLLILSLVTHLAQSQETYYTPSEKTLEFIKDFKKWNDYAYNLSLEKSDNDEQIELEYKKIIYKFCKENKIHQGISFGSHSTHSPEFEKITKAIVKKESAIIKTKFVDPSNSFRNANYEYHFVKIENKWFLEEVYLVDKDGKYEGL